MLTTASSLQHYPMNNSISHSQGGGRHRKERFLLLLDPVYDGLCRFARAMTRDREEARDLVADTLLVAWEGFDRLRDDLAFQSWLFTIARRSMHRGRRRRERFTEFDRELAEQIPDPGATRECTSDVERLYQTLARLPEQQREALVLFEISGFSIEEIRQLQGGTISGVKGRLRRGRARMVLLLGARDDDDHHHHLPTVVDSDYHLICSEENNNHG